MATLVWWVGRQAAATSRTIRASPKPFSAAHTPTGAMRMAAPLVTPVSPTDSRSWPPRRATSARMVLGPTVNDPSPPTLSNQASSSSATRRGSSAPPLRSMLLLMASACSVSSVTWPAA
jgi:hypothetical protein